jgi:hypothetical protein
MPSIRLLEGDMNFLLARFYKLENKLTSLASTIATITTELQCLQNASLSSQVLSTCRQPYTDQLTGQQPNINNQALTVNSQHASDVTAVSGKTTSRKSWAEHAAEYAASTSTPSVARHLTSIQPHRSNTPSQSESTDDQVPFTVVHARKKRRRPPSFEISNHEGQNQLHKQPDHRRQQKKPLLVGKLQNNSPSTEITAARKGNPYIHTSVFI